MQNRCASLCLFTALMLVLLRLTIGWHFFSEGSSHLKPNWSSEGFLRQAKGPLAPYFHSVLPQSDYGLDATLHAAGDADDAIDRWAAGVNKSWQRDIETFRRHYAIGKPAAGPPPAAAKPADSEAAEPTAVNHEAVISETEQQAAALAAIGRRREQQFAGWLDEHRADLVEHVHQWQRLAKARLSASAEEVPFEKKRVTEAQAKLSGEASAWLAHVRSIEHDMRTELNAALTPAQLVAGPPAGEPSTLSTIDRVMKYGILAIGACLVVGLFARLASLLGALFLASVVLSQPPWLAEAAPTYPQFLEMLALFTLATVPVGRWCGLDFFLHYLFGRRRRKAIDEPHS